MIVAGIGCQREVQAAWVQAAIEAALRQSGRHLAEIGLLATLPGRSADPGLLAATAALGLTLVAVPEADLRAAASRCLTDSPRVRAAVGLPSVAETAALAAAGPGARLLAPRVAVEGATCALAEGPVEARPAAGPAGARSAQGPAEARSAAGPAGARSAQGPAEARSAEEPVEARLATGPAGGRPAEGPAGARPAAGPAGARSAEGPVGARPPEGPAGARPAAGPIEARPADGPAGGRP